MITIYQLVLASTPEIIIAGISENIHSKHVGKVDLQAFRKLIVDFAQNHNC